MTKIEKDNRLMAEFLGKSRHVPGNKNSTNLLREGGIFFPNCADSPDGVPRNFYPYSELQYHCSWHWLTPVVDKIEKVSGRPILRILMDNHFSNERTNSKIEATWMTCVNFIKWYNENK